jgi:hypothetical protein
VAPYEKSIVTIFVLYFRRRKTGSTKVCETLTPGSRKLLVSRTTDVYDLDPEGEEDVCGDMDPHATLPFISHHTLNLTREIDDRKL